MLERSDRVGEQLGSRVARVFQTEPFVFLDEKEDVVLLAVDEADIGLGTPPFAADIEWYVFASAGHAMTFDVAEGFEQLNGEIIDCRFFRVPRPHSKVEEVDKFSVAIGNHVFSVLCGEELAIDGRRQQVVCSEESMGVLELCSDVVCVEIVRGPVTARLGRPDELSHRMRGIESD